jgi:hypothetical protein
LHTLKFILLQEDALGREVDRATFFDECHKTKDGVYVNALTEEKMVLTLFYQITMHGLVLSHISTKLILIMVPKVHSCSHVFFWFRTMPCEMAPLISCVLLLNHETSVIH